MKPRFLDRALYEMIFTDPDACPGCGMSVREPSDCGDPGGNPLCGFTIEEYVDSWREGAWMQMIIDPKEKILEEGGFLPDIPHSHELDELAIKNAQIDDDRIRVGDTVKIVSPIRFIRCGYPLYKRKAIDILLSEHREDLADFFSKMGIADRWTVLNMDREHFFKRGFGATISGLAYQYMKSRGFGGRERSVYEEPLDIGYTGTLGIVADRRHVMTGTYYAPSGGYDSWSGEYDYEPGGLDGQKRVDILWFQGYRSDPNRPDSLPAQFVGWIKLDNVEKVRVDWQTGLEKERLEAA